MRIYISGKISGLPLDDVKVRFADAKSFLDEIGFEDVNTLEKGFADDEPW